MPRTPRSSSSSSSAGGQSLAIVLHGKIGSMLPISEIAASVLITRSVDGARASPTMMTLCYASLLQHIIQPNQRRGISVDVFGHSWSPEVAGLLDALYQPARSQHEPVRHDLSCPRDDFLPKECHRTVSHLLGIKLAMLLKIRHERESRGGATYDSVFMSRWDVLWSRPMALPGLPGWAARHARTVWLPHHCVARLGGLHGNTPMKAAICGGGGKGWRGPQAAHECRPDTRACRGDDMTLAARETYLLDWWVVLGSSAAADVFALGMADNMTALSAPLVSQDGQSGRLCEAIPGHHGLLRLHLKA